MATKDAPKGKSDDLWWYGPDFLNKQETEWPNSFPEPEEILEIRRVAVVKCAKSETVPEVERISKWLVLIRATACVRLACDVFLKKRQKIGELTPEDEVMGEREVAG